ncbi:M23 family metallopeptidase [Lewinella sp. 4G2]|uniref:M23 family metallopeptidase n=1 Tax=Lewinella sp. 4G2 TaxID=1803372 RepID=UPI0007B4C5C0|nr:M23 family metallopeptidase [Lewinella sp. 4G2]OAV43994.1 hypothetical protein A3850_005565 [Lewinella sp. 4G2]
MDTPQADSWWRRLINKRNDEYQVVLRDIKSYREIGQYNLTPLSLLIYAMLALGVFAFLLFLLIAFTPLRSYIPGYGNRVHRQEMVEMEGLMKEMSEHVEAQDLYISTLIKTLRGEATTGEDIPDIQTLADTSNAEILGASEDEVRLRREMDLERLGAAARQPGANVIAGTGNVPLSQIYLAAPVNGEISAAFDRATDHLGVDILAPKNTPIKACRDGVVFISEFTSANGNVIGIQHDNNLISFYKHNSQLLKKVGERVKVGEAVAIIGNTGELTSGPHLHFEIWHRGEPVDPVAALRF